MIGVIAAREERPVVEEFFELFKTPWEWFDQDRSYQIILMSGNRQGPLDAGLLLVYSSASTQWDPQGSASFSRKHGNCLVKVGDATLPIYGEIATFKSRTGCIATLLDDGDPIGVEFSAGSTKVVRLGYNLFQEVAFLLSQGQPAENAAFPTLDLHIAALRGLIIGSGIPIVEIPPAPAGARFVSCLTHDIDFLSLRQHKFDHTMWGFLYRATFGSVGDYLKGRIGLRQLTRNCTAAAKLPLVHLGLCEDFWLPFDRYVEIEGGKASTFFLVPFKNQCGTVPNGSSAKRRATRYDVGDVEGWISRLRDSGHEIAVHGIDAWHDAAKGKEELHQIAVRTDERDLGIRMHWLYFSEGSPQALEAAGFSYDSTCGFNEAVGFRAGTSQVFKPLGVKNLMELPLHVQDTAMFYRGRMNLSELEAWALCMRVLGHCRQHGGVLTVLWHDRSLVPERCWDRFYTSLIQEVEAAETWFGTAKQVVQWFRKRRTVLFREVRRTEDRVEVRLDSVPEPTQSDLALRFYTASKTGALSWVEVPLRGRSEVAFELDPKKIMGDQNRR